MLNGFLLQLIAGAWITFKMAISALILGLILGLLASSAELSRNRIVSTVTTGIVTLLRGLPELLIIFTIYFGGTLLLTALCHTYVEINAFVAGFIALGLIFAAYASQTFRGAFLALPKGQREAAKALGLSNWHTFKRITMPQTWRYALPGLGNLWLVLLKDTALVSLIGLADLMNKTQIAATETRKPFTFYLTAAVFYLLVTTLSQQVINIFNKRSHKHLQTS